MEQDSVRVEMCSRKPPWISVRALIQPKSSIMHPPSGLATSTDTRGERHPRAPSHCERGGESARLPPLLAVRPGSPGSLASAPRP
jgi:hypothetical protein